MNKGPIVQQTFIVPSPSTFVLQRSSVQRAKSIKRWLTDSLNTQSQGSEKKITSYLHVTQRSRAQESFTPSSTPFRSWLQLQSAAANMKRLYSKKWYNVVKRDSISLKECLPWDAHINSHLHHRCLPHPRRLHRVGSWVLRLSLVDFYPTYY